MAIAAAVVWLTFWIMCLVIAGGIMYGAYLAQQGRLRRERLAAAPPTSKPDPVIELTRTTEEIALRLAESRRLLDSVKTSFQRGLQG